MTLGPVVIDYLTKGISSSALARRWNSLELITLDLKSMETVLADEKLLESLEQIEMFKNISDDLSALISQNKELQQKKLSKEKLTAKEKKQDDEAKKRKEDIKRKLQRFLTRIPAFMYLTDDREKNVLEIVTQVEPELFEKVTTLSLNDFKRLVDARVFNASKMDDAVWKFRKFEEPSLSYSHPKEITVVGGWAHRRDERFARIIERGVLKPGESLFNNDEINPVEAIVTNDFGILVQGIRHESPTLAAKAVNDTIEDGWLYWRKLDSNGKLINLKALL